MSTLHDLAARWEATARTYRAQAGLLAGSTPSDATPEQSGMIYSAGTYATCAAELRKAIGSHPVDALWAEAKEQLLSRLTSVMMDVVAGNISCGKAREILREEGYPSSVWGQLLPVIHS